MKLGTLFWRAALGMLLVVAAAQYWLVQRSHDMAAQLAARLIPHGNLRYEKIWPDLWGSGRVWGLSFEPAGLTQLSLQLPPGFRLYARQLRIHGLQLAADGSLERVRGTFLDVQIPVAERRAPRPERVDAADMPAPTLFDLGYPQLQFDMDFSVQYIRDPGVALIELNAAGVDLGRAYVRAQLGGAPEVFSRAPDQILLRQAELQWADSGLGQRFKNLSAARSRTSQSGWEQALIARLDRLVASRKWRWDNASVQAARRAIRDPSHLRAGINPPGNVVLRNIRLYPVGDWPPLLGFTLSDADSFDHPLPGQPLP